MTNHKKIISLVLSVILIGSTIQNSSLSVMASDNDLTIQEVSQNSVDIPQNSQSEPEIEETVESKVSLKKLITICQFADIVENIQEQYVEVGAEEVAISFPTTLTMKVQITEVATDVEAEDVTIKENDSVSENSSKEDIATDENSDNVSENQTQESSETTTSSNEISPLSDDTGVEETVSENNENVPSSASLEPITEEPAVNEEESIQSYTEEQSQEVVEETIQTYSEEEIQPSSDSEEEIQPHSEEPIEQDELEITEEIVENEALYTQQSAGEIRILEELQEITLENIDWVIDVENSDSATFVSDETAFGYHYTYVPLLPSTDENGNLYVLADGTSLPMIHVTVGQTVMKTLIDMNITEVVMPAELSVMFNPEQIGITINGKTTDEQVISAGYGVLNKGTQDKIVRVNFTLEDKNATQEGNKVQFVSSREEVANAGEGVYAIYLEAVLGKVISEITKDTNGSILSNVEIEADASKAVPIPGKGSLEFVLEKSTYKLKSDDSLSGNGIANDTGMLELYAIGENSCQGFTLSGCMNTNADWTRLSKGIGISVTYEIMDVEAPELEITNMETQEIENEGDM